MRTCIHWASADEHREKEGHYDDYGGGLINLGGTAQGTNRHKFYSKDKLILQLLH